MVDLSNLPSLVAELIADFVPLADTIPLRQVDRFWHSFLDADYYQHRLQLPAAAAGAPHDVANCVRSQLSSQGDAHHFTSVERFVWASDDTYFERRELPNSISPQVLCLRLVCWLDWHHRFDAAVGLNEIAIRICLNQDVRMTGDSQVQLFAGDELLWTHSIPERLWVTLRHTFGVGTWITLVLGRVRVEPTQEPRRLWLGLLNTDSTKYGGWKQGICWDAILCYRVTEALMPPEGFDGFTRNHRDDIVVTIGYPVDNQYVDQVGEDDNEDDDDD